MVVSYCGFDLWSGILFAKSEGHFGLCKQREMQQGIVNCFRNLQEGQRARPGDYTARNNTDSPEDGLCQTSELSLPLLPALQVILLMVDTTCHSCISPSLSFLSTIHARKMGQDSTCFPQCCLSYWGSGTESGWENLCRSCQGVGQGGLSLCLGESRLTMWEVTQDRKCLGKQAQSMRISCIFPPVTVGIIIAIQLILKLKWDLSCKMTSTVPGTEQLSVMFLSLSFLSLRGSIRRAPRPPNTMFNKAPRYCFS
jgi:hypothetical protein